jgi:hypothetical protein
LAERDEFELPVPICERSGDGQVELRDIETNCKAPSRCSAFLVRFRVAGTTGAKWPALLFESPSRQQPRGRSSRTRGSRRLEIPAPTQRGCRLDRAGAGSKPLRFGATIGSLLGLRRDDTAVIPRLYEVFSKCIGESIRKIGDLEVDL